MGGFGSQISVAAGFVGSSSSSSTIAILFCFVFF
jgi:hypothetical protein